MRRGIWIAGALLLAGGCGLQARVRQAPPDAGDDRVHAGATAEVLDGADRVLAAAGYDHREQGWLGPGRRTLVASTLGRAARVVVEEHPTDCRVWILVKTPLGDETTDRAAARALHDSLARALGGLPSPAPQASVEREIPIALSLEPASALVAEAAEAAGFAVRTVDDIAGELRTLAGVREDGTRVFLALYRRAEGGSRLVADVRGDSPDGAELLECALEAALARHAGAALASEK